MGVKGSVEIGLTASLPRLYRVDRLLLLQHQWWKLDDMILFLLKLTQEAAKSNCHIMFGIDGKHLLLRSTEPHKRMRSARFPCVGTAIIVSRYVLFNGWWKTVKYVNITYSTVCLHTLLGHSEIVLFVKCQIIRYFSIIFITLVLGS